MKIMHFIHGLSTGGAETLVKDYALKLKQKKYDIVVLCLSHCYDSPYEKLLLDNNIRIIFASDYLKFGNNNLFFKVCNRILKYFIVKKIIHEEEPDILHTHLSINKYVKFARPKKNVKIFHTVHSLPKVLWPSNRNSDFKAAKWLVKNYNMRFICLHDDMKNEVDKMFSINNSIVVNNGIDFSRFERVFDKNSIMESLGIEKDSFVIGHVGRFSKVKNHEFLLSVFSEIYKVKKNAFLLLIGSGVEKENIIRKLIDLDLEDRCLILSNRNDIPDLLSIMNAFVFPSRYEGLGIALIEAQKMNLPCFVSDNIPSQTIISNLVTQMSLNSSPSEWATKILNFNFPKAIKLYDDEWNIDKAIDKLENIYDSEE